MSISSVTTPPLPLPPSPPPQPVQAKAPDPSQDTSNSSPPVQAPLPPGQGTRVNIIA